MNPATHSPSIYRYARLFSFAFVISLCAMACSSVPSNSSQPDDGRDTLPGTIDDGSPSEEDFTIDSEAVDAGRTQWELSVSSQSVDLSEFTFAWTLDDGTEFVGSSVLVSFTEGGLHSVRLTVIGPDNRELFVRNVQVEVPEVNEPPVASAGDDRVAPENEVVFLYGDDSSDPEGRTLSYVWSQVSGPEVLLTNAEQETATFTSPLVSEDTEFEFLLTVSDGEQYSEDTVFIIIQDSMSDGDDPGDGDGDPGDGDVVDGADADEVPCTEFDADADGASDCDDGCPNDAAKTTAGTCGCGTPDTDANANGIPDCVDVVVSPNPATLSVSAGADTSIVEGASVVLSGLAVNGTPPYTYTWSPSNYLDNPQSAQPMATPTETMSYTLMVTDSALSSAQASVNVFVVAPLVANAGPNVTIPTGGSTQLVGSATGGFTPYTYTWSPQSGLNNPNIYNPIATPNSTRTYTLTVRDVYGRSASDGVLVTVSNSNLSVNAGADVTIPTGGSTQLAAVATGGIAPFTYQWTPQSGLSNPNIANPVAQPNSSRSYTVTVTDSASNTATDSVYVTVQNFVVNAGPDVSINSGSSTTLQGSASGGVTPYTYLWSPTTGLNNPNIATPVATPNVTRTYTLTVTDAQSLVATDNVVVTVSNFTANAGPDVTIAPGASTTLAGSATGGTTPYTYTWSPTTGLNNPNIANPVATPTTTRTYTVTARDAQNRTATDSMTVTVQAAAPVLAVSPTALTFSSSTTTSTFNVWNSGTGTLNYTISDNATWLTASPTSGSSTGEQDSITATVNRTGLANGTYEAVITVTPSVGSALTVAVTMIVGNPGFGTMSTANRSNGVAPLGVIFDAVSASSGVVQPSLVNGRRDFASFQYRWNFGDNAQARWSTDNDLKNEAYGQVASHVFETPGTFNVTLTVTQASGAIQTYQQTITVTDPEVVYANSSPSMAERTFYVAAEGADTNNGSFNSPFRTWTHARSRLFAASGPRRILLKRGQTFTHSTNSTISNRTGPYTIGAYGTGANPVIQHTGNSGEVLALDATATDVRVMDISIVGTTGAGNGFRPGTNTLILRCSMTGLGNGVSTSDLFGDRANNFIVDCMIVNNQRYGIYYNFGQHVTIMGTTIDNVDEEHLVRCYITHSVISHNVFRNGHSNKHQLKFCGYFPTGNPERSPGTPTEAVEHSIISDNRFETSGPIDWVITIGPVDQSKDQRIQDCIFERNLVKADTGTEVLLYANNEFNTVRNNVFDMSGGSTSVTGIRVTRRGIEPPPNGYTLYNNTFYRPGTGSPVAMQVDSMATNTTARNNLLAATSGTVLQNGGQGLISSNNLLFASAGLVNPANGDYSLLATSPAVDAGTSVPSVFTDYVTAQRPFDGNNAGGPQWDVGAYEYRTDGGNTNVAPSANAGADQSVTLPTNQVSLDGTVTDDGRPNPPALVTTLWTKTSGPGTVTFGNAASVDTTATFSAAGTYVLRLTANDSVLSANDEMTVIVNPGAQSAERMGINLSKLFGWGSQIVFVDAFKHSRDWISANADGTSSDTGVTVPVDANGYPLQIPYNNGVNPPQIVRTIMLDVEAGTYPSGIYTLIFTGNGTITLGNNAGGTFNQTGGTQTYTFPVTTPTSSGIQLRITRSEAADHVRDIRVIMPGYASTYTTQPFYPPFLSRLQGFGTIRFMEWMRTNGNDRLVQWSDRTTPASMSQSQRKGASFEHAIQLSNTLNADPWFCIPHLASDDFVTQLARLIRDNLSPQRKVYIEYSNEVWNGMFEQSTYARDQGVALGLGPDPTLATRRFYAKRSAEIFRIFQTEFGAQQSRVVRVLAGQAASSNVLTQIIQAFQQPSINGVPINPNGATASAVAIAPYFGNGLADSIVTNNEVNSITVAEILNRLTTTYLPTAITRMQQNKAVADQYSLPMLAYEGGQHLAGTGNNVNNATLTQKLHDANRNPGMYTLYRSYFDAWFANGGGVFDHYAFCQMPNGYGYWGVLDHLGQTTTDSQKYRALMDVVALPD